MSAAGQGGERTRYARSGQRALSGLSDRLGFKLWEFTYKPQFANSNIPIVAELVKQRLDSSKRLLSYYP